MSSPDGYLALYCRLSKARNGQVESVGRQERWGREYAAQHLPDLPIRVFVDNDVSAFDDDAYRKDYETLRQEIREKRPVAVWCVEQTRLEANRKRWVELAVELAEADITVIHTNRDGLVRLDEVADIKNVLAWHERQRLRERVNDTLGDLAKAGRPSGGRSFGYRHVKENNRSRIVVVEEEAAAARWAAEAVLSGWTWTAVGAELDRRGLPCRHGGKRWTPDVVRKMLTAPSIAAKRVYQGEIVGDAEWKPILDEITWRRLVALWDSRKGKNRPRHRYLLSGGLTVCGREGCGTSMTGERQTIYATKKTRKLYVCAKTRGGCAKVAVQANYLEGHVTEVVLEYLNSATFRRRIAQGDPHKAERERLVAALGELDNRRRKLAARAGRGEIDDDEWDVARATIAEEKGRLQTQLAEVPVPVIGVDPDAVIDAWPDATNDEKRFVLGRVLSRIVVNPTAKRGPGFDADRVEIYEANGNRLS